MHNLATKHDDRELWFGFGRVLEVGPDHFVVDSPAGAVTAEKAEGCLVAPQPGDRVLLACGGDEEAFILNVLKRSAPDSPAPIHLGENATLQAAGQLNVLAGKVEVEGTEATSLKTGEFSLSCVKGRARFGDFLFNGGLVSGRVDSIKTAARHVETTAARVIDRFKRHYRRIEEFEDSRIGRVTLWVGDLFSVNSRSTALKSKDRVEVDADRILLG